MGIKASIPWKCDLFECCYVQVFSQQIFLLLFSDGNNIIFNSGQILLQVYYSDIIHIGCCGDEENCFLTSVSVFLFSFSFFLFSFFLPFLFILLVNQTTGKFILLFLSGILLVFTHVLLSVCECIIVCVYVPSFLI